MKRALAAVLALLAGAWLIEGHAPARARRAPRGLAPLGKVAACERYSGLPLRFGSDPYAGMVAIRGESFTPGSQHGYPEERPAQPARAVVVADFFIDRTEVTNAQFARFVAATGYVTSAERAGESALFAPPAGPELPVAHLSWWRSAAGVSWRTPDGPGSDLRGRAHHPVVHVSHEDAQAYARWLGRALPSEDQWEYAARLGMSADALDAAPTAGGKALANFWQGDFPGENRAEDGFRGAAPVGCYPASPAGLHDMIGNVWEWTADDYALRSEPARAGSGAAEAASCHGAGAGDARKVIKGGSFLCSPNFCARYRASARHAHEAAIPTAHIGFRTVRPYP